MRFPAFLAFLGLIAAAPAATAQTFQSLYSFPADGSNGATPRATLTVGPDYALYGTTYEGGLNNSGTVFKITTTGTFSVIDSLAAATTGKNPSARLVAPGDGYLYGATERNSGVSGDPVGTVFKVDPAGGVGALSVVFQLPGSGSDPKTPKALLPLATDKLLVLGSSPGGLWQVTTAGSGESKYTFGTTAQDGVFPSTLIQGKDGIFYGTTEGISYVGTDPGLRGTIFSINADGTGMTKLHDCLQGTGTTPSGAMAQDADGNLYGTMFAGGNNSYGVIFKLTPLGEYSVLYHFSSSVMSYPNGDLLLARDGYLYGTASRGGASNVGGVFRIKTDGTGFKTLVTFNNTNGAIPRSGLALADDGNLYGTTTEGGSGGKGTIFRITVDMPLPNRAPLASDDWAQTSGDAVLINVLANDFDPEAGLLTVDSVSTPSAGAAEIQGDGTILYTPDPMLYTGSDSFTYTIRDPQGETATATVTVSGESAPALFTKGFYNGLLLLDPALDGSGTIPRGQFFVAVSDTGAFTGYLIARKKRVSFKGNFGTSGIASAKVNIPGFGKAVLFLGFEIGQEGIGAVLYGKELWSGGGAALGTASGNLETYTVAIDTSLEGWGFATMKIDTIGLISFVGKMPDGSAFSCVSTLAKADPGPGNVIPLFCEPVLGGYLSGVLTETGNSNAPYEATVAWKRPVPTKANQPYPSGIEGSADVTVFSYTEPATVGTVLDFGSDFSGEVDLSKGPLTNPITGTFLSTGTSFKGTAPLASLSINKKTGVFTGRMKNGTQTIPFAGVIVQPEAVGVGFFRTSKTGDSGQVALLPEPVP